MVLAIALESLVKLVAFVAIGLFALWHLPGTDDFTVTGGGGPHAFTAPQLPAGFLAQTLLGFLAIICLPRQFHVAVVECQDPADIRNPRAGCSAAIWRWSVPWCCRSRWPARRCSGADACRPTATC
jgi:Na+/proline symporter